MLTLIPTPLQEDLPLEPIALQRLQETCLKPESILLVEEHKVARQRWLRYGLPREAIDRFVLFNEHTQTELAPKIVNELKQGKHAYLMSDGGLPAFYDPGQNLVDLCHRAQLKVTSTPFPNSIALAVALSGFPHQEFFFAGFLPANADERKARMEHLAKMKSTIVLMDTPYRLQSLLKDLSTSSLQKRNLFLATELNGPSEKLFRGPIVSVLNEIGSLNKVEFVMVFQQ